MYTQNRRRHLSQSLADLEAARTKLLQQFLTLGDFPARNIVRRAAPLWKTLLSLRSTGGCRASSVPLASQG